MSRLVVVSLSAIDMRGVSFDANPLHQVPSPFLRDSRDHSAHLRTKESFLIRVASLQSTVQFAKADRQ